MDNEKKLGDMKNELYLYLKNAPETDKVTVIRTYWQQWNVILRRFKQQCVWDLDLTIEEADQHIQAVKEQYSLDLARETGIRVQEY